MTIVNQKRPWEIDIQLWSQKQDVSVLDLLLFLGPPLLPADTKLIASRWAFGRLHAVRAENANDLTLKLAKSQMNQVVIKPILREFSYSSLQGIVTEFRTQLYNAPSSFLWGNAIGYTAPSSSAERLRWTFEAQQKHLCTLKTYPTETITTIKLETPRRFFELQEAFVPIIASSLEKCSLTTEIAGGADFLLPDEYETHKDYYPGLLGLTANIHGGRRAFKSLKNRWDALHPILIGPYNRCKRLCGLLKVPTILRKVGFGADSQVLGVLAIRGRGYHWQEYRSASRPKDDPRRRIAWGQPEWYDQAASLLIPLTMLDS